ncbi:hypothetical protein Glove_420g8 [Diversispora epigaea]|uniref:CCHC-type domain-containing protein n=1 Tax=Diversispora epigaea TaxID=1348612 RepID=A0A397H409_9GLOM|nr:hypothetical protein Glove_420g8 [Diversispora epigaea]
MSNTLNEAVEKAKAFESAFSRREPIAAYSATRQPAHSTSVETALTKLTETISTMVNQYGRRENHPGNNYSRDNYQRENYPRNSYPRNNNSNNNNGNSNRPPIVCFNCGTLEHVMQECDRPRTRPDANRPGPTANNTGRNNPPNEPSTVQNLLNILTAMRTDEEPRKNNRNEGKPIAAYSATRQPAHSTSVETALTKLTETISTMVNQYGRRENHPGNNYSRDNYQRENYPRNSYPRNNNSNNNNGNSNRPPIVCFNCGTPGHVMRECDRPRTRPDANRPGPTANNTGRNNPPNEPSTVQNLLNILTAMRTDEEPRKNNRNEGSSRNTPRRNQQQSFFSIQDEKEELLYYHAKRKPRVERTDPIITRSKKRITNDPETEEVKEVNPEKLDEDMIEEMIQKIPKLGKTNIPKKTKRALPSRRKFVEEEFPQISSLNKAANITYGQLLRAVLNMRQELSKGLQKKKAAVKRKMKTHVSIQDPQKSTALYCDARAHGQPISLIIDSGSSGSVVSLHLLKKLGVKVERPSFINMINVHGESKRAICEITAFPFVVGGLCVPVDVVVTDAHSY